MNQQPLSECYLRLAEVSQEELKGRPIAGHWRERSGMLEGCRYGGAWHPLRGAERGPGGTLLVGGMILVPEG
jgi:hypothetical protein